MIVDEAQSWFPNRSDRLARIVDDLDMDVFVFGITTDFRAELFPGPQCLTNWPTGSSSSRSRPSAGAAPAPTHTRTVGG